MLNTQTAKATPYEENTKLPVFVPPVMSDASSGQHQTNSTRKSGKRNKTISIVYANEMLPGALENALADIYARKAKNGTLGI